MNLDTKLNEYKKNIEELKAVERRNYKNIW